MRVLPAASVEGIHEPRCREPDVHILLPPLLQLKSISERFTKLALHAHSTHSSTASIKLEISATMHGDLRIGLRTEALNIESKWSGLNNPELDPEQVGGEEAVKEHPSTRMKERDGEDGWAVVRVEGRDWGRVLGVGRLGGRVVACEYHVALTFLFWRGSCFIMECTPIFLMMGTGFCHEHALILYVYLPNDDHDAEDSVLTVRLCEYDPHLPNKSIR